MHTPSESSAASSVLILSFYLLYIERPIVYQSQRMSPHESNERTHDDVVASAGEEDEDHLLPRRGRKRVKLFNESGLTDHERRALRQNQREIAQTLREGDLGEDIAELERVRHANNDMFRKQVKFTREAVLDADNLDLIAANYAQHVEKQVTVSTVSTVHSKNTNWYHSWYELKKTLSHNA
jgi:hypothetical protein